jgi:hypothetical protein
MPYPRVVEQQMKNFFDSLSEKDRRRYPMFDIDVVSPCVVRTDF